MVGCDMRAEREWRCAGTEIGEQFRPRRTPTVAHAGTPRLEFAQLVTPCRKLTSDLFIEVEPQCS